MNDEDWHEKVEEHLLRDLIEDLEARIKEHDVILKGERRSPGLLAEYIRHDELLRRMYAVIWQDPTGQKGLLHDVDILLGRKVDRQRGREFRWQFWTAIAVAAITSVTALVTNWEKIKKNLPKDHPGPLEQRIERAKHPKSPKKIFLYHVVAPKKETPSDAPTNLPSPE